VVFPAPRNPDKRVTGKVFSSGFVMENNLHSFFKREKIPPALVVFNISPHARHGYFTEGGGKIQSLEV